MGGKGLSETMKNVFDEPDSNWESIAEHPGQVDLLLNQLVCVPASV